MMGVGGAFMFLFWVGLVALAVMGAAKLFPRPGRQSLTGEDDGDAMQILNRRYARGEIGRAQYEQMKETILEQAQ